MPACGRIFGNELVELSNIRVARPESSKGVYLLENHALPKVSGRATLPLPFPFEATADAIRDDYAQGEVHNKREKVNARTPRNPYELPKGQWKPDANGRIHQIRISVP